MRGLNDVRAARLLKACGPNEPRELSRIKLLERHVLPVVLNPLVVLLLGLGGAAYWGGDPQTGQVIWAMMMLAVGMQTAQEVRGERAAASLKCALASSCRVLRGSDGTELVHVDVKGLVPGDVCHVAAGDVVPADGVLIESNFLQVNQSRLTGESACVRKYANTKKVSSDLLTLDMSPDDPGTLLTSSTVVSGSGYFRVVHTGDCTELGKTMGALNNMREPSRFDKDMQAFTWMMIRFIFVLAPLVALVQLLKQGWCMDAFMYAVSVSVGLAPEMMPMIITTCLVHGASVLSRRYKVIVKRINAMQALGTVSVLCTDKTGTLTCDCLSVHRSLDAQGAENTQEADLCLTLAKLNAHFQDDGSNSIDAATRASAMASFSVSLQLVSLVDRVPFDFEKRTAAVRVRFRGDLQAAPSGLPSTALVRLAKPGMDLVILKGAAEEIIALCDGLERESGADEGKPNVCKAQALEKALARCAGERLLGVAIGYVNSSFAGRPHVQDQDALSLAGFVSFTDPPKASARTSIAAMLDLGVAVKMLTGDSASVAALVAEQVGIPSASSVITGPALDRMDEASFREALAQCTVFAKLTPQNKFRIISELKSMGCDTAMLGDGVNDVAALQVADVGISVDSACDASRSAADILLTEKDLAVLRPCVLAGRRVFANMVKYLKMAASSNFGNMFSVVGASLFVPFIPMLPLQVVLSNFLYDFAQLGIPSDAVDEELLTEPLRLNVDGLQRFIVAVGWISSFFDCVTFAVMYFVLGGDASNPALFQTGWFVEGLLSQTLIVYVLRSRKPFNWLRRYRCVNALVDDPRVYRRSGSYAAPSPLLNALSICVCLSGVFLARAPRFRKMLKFSTLPASYWVWLTLILASYMFATYVVIDRVAGNQKLFSRKGRSKRYHLRASGVVASTV